MDMVQFHTYGPRDFFWETVGNVASNFGLLQRPVPALTALEGQTVIVTGGNKGIGRDVSMDMAARGARVIIACRDEAAGKAVVDEIKSKSPLADAIVKHLDLRSRQSIRQFAESIIASETRVDCLVNNAGVMYSDRRKTEDGLEANMGVNYFGLVYLTMSLLDKMRTSSADPRVVSVSSMAHGNITELDLSDMNMEKSFSLNKAYGSSKLAVIMFSRELARRQRQVRVYAVDPGFSATNLFDELPWFIQLFVKNPLTKLILRPVRTASNSVIHAIVQPAEKYDPENNYLYDGAVKVPRRGALVTQDCEKLWNETCRVLDLDSMKNM